MNSTISGCPAFRMTIFAARRVLPPDLITPANASNPFINDTGPDAIPPPESCSFEERIGERLLPVPDPHLKSIPSVLASSRMEPIVSSTELMKHAEHCGFTSIPQLNHTGELKAIIWFRSRCTSSSWKIAASWSLAKYPPCLPHPVMVVATRPTSWRTLVSRSGVPFLPWKYLEATILVAVIDQPLGTSTFFCSKMTSPDSLVIAAVRYSHSTVSYGEMPSRVKYRRNSKPF